MRCWLRLLWYSQLYCHILSPPPCCNLEVSIVTICLLFLARNLVLALVVWPMPFHSIHTTWTSNYLFTEWIIRQRGYMFIDQNTVDIRLSIFLNFLVRSCCKPYISTNPPAMIPIYGGVLSTIEKALQELVKEYWGVRKSLWDLVKSQERNMAQLAKIGATMEQR